MYTLKGKKVELYNDHHPEDIVSFLSHRRGIEPETLDHEILHDPLLMPDIVSACRRIFLARDQGEKVMIFGDYDVDGISSTAALFLFLRDELGMSVSYRLPHRVRDGYGIKNYHMDEIAATGTTLIITVDCGTKDIEPIQHAKTLGLDVIVTDHHSCPDILPECVAVVNPRRSDGEYPFPALSGSGVVWKVIHALLKNTEYIRRGGQNTKQDQEIEKILQKYVDIVSLGTVADCMPMIDENRTIVRRGLSQARRSHHPFFQTFEQTLARPILTEEDIGFFVGPMLNAGGRITTPYQSMSALLAGSLDAYARIQELIVVNETRKGMSRDAYERALQQVDSSAPYITIIDEKLEHGILGLVAARLCETFYRPVGVFTRDHDHFVGSMRAPPGMDLVRILDQCADRLLRYGGHAGAAGCSVGLDAMSDLGDALNAATAALYDTADFSPVITVDTRLDIDRISRDFVASIETLRPFGPGFESPNFMIGPLSHDTSPLGQTGEHVRWNTPIRGLDIIGFRMTDYLTDLTTKDDVYLIGQIKTRTWRDVVTVQFLVSDVVHVTQS